MCNPSLLSKNYFVLSSLLAKMSSKVYFFITINSKLNLEGSGAFKRMPPGMSKIWKRSLFWLFRAASSSYELPALPPLSLPVATPGKDSTAAAVKIIKIVCNIASIFTLIQFFNILIFKKRQISKIVTKLVYISELLSTFFVIFLVFALYFCGKNQYCIVI
jgi:hypothetical protein